MSVNKREYAESIEYHLFKANPKSFIFYKVLRSIGRIFFSHGLIVILFGLLMMFICNNANGLKDVPRTHKSDVVMKNNSDCNVGVVPVNNYLNVFNVSSSEVSHESAAGEKVRKNVKSRVEGKSSRNETERRGCSVLPGLHNSNR